MWTNSPDVAQHRARARRQCTSIRALQWAPPSHIKTKMSMHVNMQQSAVPLAGHDAHSEGRRVSRPTGCWRRARAAPAPASRGAAAARAGGMPGPKRGPRARRPHRVRARRPHRPTAAAASRHTAAACRPWDRGTRPWAGFLPVRKIPQQQRQPGRRGAGALVGSRTGQRGWAAPGVQAAQQAQG
jgi:hypothetical protein